MTWNWPCWKRSTRRKYSVWLTGTVHTFRQWLPWVDGTLAVDDTREFILRSLEQYAKGEGLVARHLARGQPRRGRQLLQYQPD